MWLLLFSFLLLLLPSSAQAISDFTINQSVKYQVNNAGIAVVKQEVNLLNNLSQVYPKEYQITLSQTDITNIRAYDKIGDILKTTTTTDGKTVIFLKFNQPSVGKDQSTQFFLTYNINNFALNKGKTWEISLPQYQPTTSGEKSISISISVPQSFGKLSFSSIPNLQPEYSGHQTQIDLNPNQVDDRRILLIFGNYQLFDFQLTYFLQNSSSSPIETEIAIPPDTDYQKVTYRSISPSPLQVYSDQDGNWLAKYRLAPQQKIEINASGQVKLSPPKNIGDKKTDLKDLTKEQKYWPTTDPTIQQLASTYHQPKQIYDYVINTLDYDYQLTNSNGRKGAVVALQNPQFSLCTEFTDLFIAIARANNIPAREIEGYANTNNLKIKPINQNADILHAWPQYYNPDQNRWISIDPTWGKTTNGIDYFNELDLNHFTFVIHGNSSDYPPPPGSYKNNLQQKVVKVDFADQEISHMNETLTARLNPSSLLDSSYTVVINNPNLNSLNNLSISPSAQIKSNQTIIPPLGNITISIPKPNFIASILPQNNHLRIIVSADEYSQPTTISIKNPNYYLNLTVSICILIVILCFLGIILTASNKKPTL